MAAGLSIKRVHLPRFAVIFDKAVQHFSHAEMLQARLITDGELDTHELSLQMAEHLAAAGPWGSGFPEPSFCGEFELVSQRVVGDQHLKMVLKKGARIIDAIAFRQAPVATNTEHVRVVYKLSVNDYGQIPTPQLMVDFLEAL